MDFSSKIIWITGATSGIGRAVAMEISRSKTHLILSGRNEKALAETGKICQKNGSMVELAAFDLGDEKAVLSAAEAVLKKMERVDCLYHFGGISQRGFVNETSAAVDRKIFEVNFFGTVLLTKAVLPAMIKNGGGHIAVTSSIVGKFGFPYRSAYSASKHALHGYFESLRSENANNKIRVSIIIPGRIQTSISVNALDKEGQKYGKMDAGLNTGMKVEKAARKITEKLKAEKKEILVGGNEIMMVHIRRFFPRLYYYLASRVKPL